MCCRRLVLSCHHSIKQKHPNWIQRVYDRVKKTLFRRLGRAEEHTEKLTSRLQHCWSHKNCIMPSDNNNETKDAMNAFIPSGASWKGSEMLMQEAETIPSTSIDILVGNHATDNTDASYNTDASDNDDRELDEQQVKMKRILSNRRSAQVSYRRRKLMIAELKDSVSKQSIQNASLEAENALLRDEITELRQQVLLLLSRQEPTGHARFTRPELALIAALGLSRSGSHLTSLPRESVVMPSRNLPTSEEMMSLRINKDLIRSLAGFPLRKFGMYWSLFSL